MIYLGVDLNATRARAVSGSPGEFAQPLPLDPPALELPMIFSLTGSTPELGTGALRHVRQMPHLICHGFLPFLGEAPRQWITPNHRLDAKRAVELVLQRLRMVCNGVRGMVIALPAYYGAAQAELLLTLAKNAHLPLLGSMPMPLAAAMAAYAEQAWFGTAVVVDVDDHALSVSVIRATKGQAHLLQTRADAHLGMRVWKDRVLNAISECCILQTRRDPRDSSETEQSLYEQIDSVLDAARQKRMIQIAVQGPRWYQNMILQPDQAVAFCGRLTHQALFEIEEVLNARWPDGSPSLVILTAAAGRLPGLVDNLRNILEEWRPPHTGITRLVDGEDFGDNLIMGANATNTAQVLVLGADGPARAAHGIVPHFQRGELYPGHLELVAPLPLPQPVDAGPARLQHQGQDHPLQGPCFILGRHPGCHLVFDGDIYPAVSGRHCEIMYDQSLYLLFDRSREGTFLNDRPVEGSAVLHPGDWIRLGPDGPLLRFLGQSPEILSLTTTA